jgi:6-phosphogluconolactonase
MNYKKNSMPTVFSFSKKQEWIESISHEVLRDVHCETLSLVLSGGSTPKEVYEYLAGKFLEQKNIRLEIFQADERCVPNDDPNSNALLITRSFIDRLPPTTFFEASFFDTEISPDQAAKKYDTLLRQNPPFDICILGIGNDGHTASLFSKSLALEERIQFALQTEAKGYPIPIRLTLTFPALLSSKKIIVLLKSKEKKAVLDELLFGNALPQDFPAKYLLAHKNMHIFFLEE